MVARTTNRGQLLRRGVLVLVAMQTVNCSDERIEQRSQGIAAAEPVRPPDGGVDVVRGPSDGAMVEFVARLPRPIPERPLVVPPPPAENIGSTPCGLNFDPIDRLETTTSAGWLVLHGRVTTTPTNRERHLPSPGGGRPGLVLRESRFEVQPIAVCSTDRAVAQRSYQVNHWNEKLHENAEHVLTPLELNLLDSRPRRALAAQGRERVFVLTRDGTSAGEWVLLASIGVENGVLQEAALDAPRLGRVDVLMSQCLQSVNGGAR